ncbi:polymer-forming cytoskeletal protein [Orrella sp. NBD-18]|uniref:Polymer-forming cytoskeletal protein n=1 Tax=Sheuella amnicola TaxID=2707330 RepID=A0A6B2QXS6_9BURK|nr:polymer-forming cytoskeletal protein [Sheuella amnicola]NDY82104.1 polymer-forming cytoskeletal protein [Sheuella amnicola]
MFGKKKELKLDEPSTQQVPVVAPSPVIAQSTIAASVEPVIVEQNIVEPSVLSKGVVIKGVIESPGALHFQCHIEGEVNAPQITVGRHGNIKGRVDCDSLTLDGFIDGTIVCTELKAGNTAHLEGSIKCATLNLALGGSINGKIDIG